MTNETSPQSRPMRPTLRTYGYLAAMIILGIAIGLLLYPLLTYPAIWQWGLMLASVILMALTAPALRKRS